VRTWLFPRYQPNLSYLLLCNTVCQVVVYKAKVRTRSYGVSRVAYFGGAS
jgi:hypothetical protein